MLKASFFNSGSNNFGVLFFATKNKCLKIGINAMMNKIALKNENLIQYK